MTTTSLIHQFGRALQEEMEFAVASPVQLLNDMLLFQIGSNPTPGSDPTLDGRPSNFRPRGILCLLVCDALSGDYRTALPAAAAVELAHQQYVVHRAISVTGNQMIHDDTRIQGRWGTGQAINAGDGLHAMARLSIARLAERGCTDDTVLSALRELDAACARTCEGLHRALLGDGKALGIKALAVEDYIDRAGMKTGSLMGCAARLGAQLADQSAEVQQVATRCGSDLGIALQIHEDMATYGGNRPDLEHAARHKISQAKEQFAQLGVDTSALAELIMAISEAVPEESRG